MHRVAEALVTSEVLLMYCSNAPSPEGEGEGDEVKAQGMSVN